MKKGCFEKAHQLWADYVRAKYALLGAGFIRSFRSTEAEFAEWLVAAIFNGRLPNNKANPAYDVIAGEKRIQVKSVTKMPDNKSGYEISKKDKLNDPTKGATHYAFVFFDELIPDVVFFIDEAFVRKFRKAEIRRRDLECANCKVDIDLSIFRVHL